MVLYKFSSSYIVLLFTLFVQVVFGDSSEINNLVTIGKCDGYKSSFDLVLLPQNFVKQLKSDDSLTTNALAEIRLESQALKCQNITSLIISIGHGKNESNQSTNIFNPKFYKTGTMRYNRTYYSRSEFCIQSISSTTLEIIACDLNAQSKCSETTPCIRKCCDIDEVIDLSEFSNGKITCRSSPTNKKWRPQLFKDFEGKTDGPQNYRILQNHPKQFCNHSRSFLWSLRPFHEQSATPFMLQNGTIMIQTQRNVMTIGQDYISQTCFDGAQHFPLDEEGSLTGTFSGDEMDTVLYDCSQLVDFEEDEDEYHTEVYIVALAIAIIFLLLTLAAHFVLLKKQTIRGWTLMCYVFYLSLQFGLLIVAKIITESGITCTLVAVGIHFTTLSTFSWLTIINFDVWWTFRTMNPAFTRREQLKQFLCYSIFSTLLPLTIVSIALLLQYSYADDPTSGVIIPDYGKLRCSLSASADLPYLFGPVSVLLGANVLFLSMTIFYIYKKSKVLKSSGVKTKMLNDKRQFFGMLFLIAGITWIFDIISWATTPAYKPTPLHWMFFDMINIFQAIAIFLVFVCNRKTIENLQKELPILSKVCVFSDQTDGNMEIRENGQIKGITQVLSVNNDERNNLEMI